MRITDEITSRVFMPDIYDRYGFTPNRAGFICCPFHEEKTPSLGAYAQNRRWKCFGCGAGGSVIDFVMQLFSLNFREAVMRINMDFGLGLQIGERPNYRERLRQVELAREARCRQQEQITARQAREQAYWEALDNWQKWTDLKELCVPQKPDQIPRPLFFVALHNLSKAEDALDLAEIERGESVGNWKQNRADGDCHPGIHTGGLHRDNKAV